MKKLLFSTFVVALLFIAGCKKDSLSENLSTSPVTASGFVEYVIPQGEHYSIGNDLTPLDISELKFTVRFDSSCIYKTINPENQFDINKLYGFSDNGALHQQYSARFGWRWSDSALRLFAYTYNNGIRASKELGIVPIGKEVNCVIRVTGKGYVFTVDEKSETMDRLSTLSTAKGYRLYPYFGGDEVAPHEVRIWIKDLTP